MWQGSANPLVGSGRDGRWATAGKNRSHGQRPAPRRSARWRHGRRVDRARADHGRAARRPPGAGQAREEKGRSGRRVHLRQPGAVRSPRGPVALSARRSGRRRQSSASVGADLVWSPAVDEMYPPGSATRIVPEGAALGLEGEFRPHHFGGVATVCCKLFNQVKPDFAVFGEKDYQQLCVIRQMVRDLDLPLKIIGMPTVREKDGLALSSRNAYLTPEERKIAPALSRALRDVAKSIAERRDCSCSRRGGPRRSRSAPDLARSTTSRCATRKRWRPSRPVQTAPAACSRQPGSARRG